MRRRNSYHCLVAHPDLSTETGEDFRARIGECSSLAHKHVPHNGSVETVFFKRRERSMLSVSDSPG